jgi:hypothetical protein
MLGFVSSLNALLGVKTTTALLTFMPAVLERAANNGKDPKAPDKNGFTELISYMTTLSGYLIPVGAGMAVLGLIYGGCLLMAGAPHAGRTLTFVVVGVVVVLASGGIAK